MKPQEKAYYYNSFFSKIVEKNYDVPIYRFIPLDRLFQILDNKQLTISQTKLWEDTYENFLTKARFKIGNISTSLIDFLPAFYGQCWTLQKETDALWRIYSNDKKGIRIKTKIHKLLGSSLNEIDSIHFSTRVRVIGQVSYMTKFQINNWIKTENKKFINAETLLKSLFIKRKEFNHEKEVRLIIHKNINREDELKGIEHKYIQLNIEPNEFIEEITFDPRIDDKVFQTYKNVILKMGFKNPINKSELYKYDRLIVQKSQLPTKNIVHLADSPNNKDDSNK